MKKTGYLQQTLFSSFTLAALIPISLGAGLIIYHLYSSAVENINLHARLLGKGLSGQVELFLSEPQSIVKNIRNMLVDMDLHDSNNVQKVLDQHVLGSRIFDSISLLGSDYRVINVGLPPGKESFRRDFIGINFSHKDFIQRAMVTRQTTWSPTFLSLISGKMSMTLCLPFDEYVLAADINIILLAEMVHNLNMEQINITVVDQSGAIIIHPDPEIVARQVMLRDIPLVMDALEGREGVDRFTFLDGEDYIGSTYLIPAAGWITLIARPVDEVYHQVYTTIIYLASGLIGSIIFIFIFAVYRARRLARPLINLSGHARTIAKGNYDLSLLPVTEYAEINELIYSIKLMTESIKGREKLLIESEQMFREVVEGTDNLIIRTDSEGRLTFVNHAGYKIFGVEPDELIGRSFFDFIYPEDMGEIRRNFLQWQQANGDDGVAFEGRLVDLEGDVHYLLWSVNFHYEEAGSLIEACFVASDISERLKAEEEKEKAEEQFLQVQKMEAIGTLAGGVAHDFNNILSAIIGYLELAKTKIPPESSANNDLDEVFKASQRATDLVRQILTFSRKTKTDKKAVKLNLLVKEAIKLLRASIPTTIEIRRDILAECPNVVADPSQIHQILMNLCTNAYHAMRGSSGILSVSLQKVKLGSDDHLMEHSLVPGDYLLLEISDTGQGISPESLTKIFEPYFTTKKIDEGTGLGLSVVHGIVKDHNGHITVYSEVGKGTTFRVYLPVEYEHEEIESQETVEEVSGGSERIIFVDDEKVLVRLGDKLLSNLGYEVAAFNNSAEAFQAFRETPENYDLIITDMTMPGMTGAELARKVKAIRSDVPIIICTGFIEDLDENSMTEMGIDAYLAKPVGRQELADTIRKVMESDS